MRAIRAIPFFICLFLYQFVWSQQEDAARYLDGKASYYAAKFHGRRTANGEIFDQKKYTAACNLVPLGTWLRVTNARSKKSVIVRVNDRMHPKMKRVVDLTRAAASDLGIINQGIARVRVEVLGKTKPKK